MTPAHRRTLPARPDLEQQKKQAKELLAAWRAGDPDAIARVRAELPDRSDIGLTHAQFVLAREYGFSTWHALREHIDSIVAEQKSPAERFRRAVERRDVAALRRLTTHRDQLRAIVNEPVFGFDSPALCSVAGSGDPALVDALLALGADPNGRSRWWAGGFHPLHSARGSEAERLLAAGAVPDACAAANLDRADLLARMLAEDPSRVHERGGDGQTPLHFARSREVADLLLGAGADPDARDVDHRSTPAQWMLGDADDSAQSRLDVARHLVARGASADIFLVAALGLTDRARAMLAANPSLLSLRTSQGEYAEKPPSSYHIYQWTLGPNLTPLQVAARFGNEETLDVMRRFASPEQRLILACTQGRRDEALIIVREHSGIVERLAPADARALTDAAWAADAQAVELMLELGFDPALPSVSGPTGGTALHCAAWEGSTDCVAAILRYPAGRALLDTRDRTHNGTPLGWCCHGSVNCGNPSADHAQVARLLIEAGARVDPQMEGCSSAMQEVVMRAAGQGA